MAVTLNAPSRPSPGPRRHKITRAEFHLLGDSGLIPEGHGYELIDGEIFETMGQKEPHGSLVMGLLLKLIAIFGGDFVRCQLPIVADDHSEPEPDVSVTARSREEYLASRATPPAAEVRLAAEVSVTTLGFDLGRKSRVYALAGIPEYWCLDAEARKLIVHRDPSPDGYRTVTVLDESQSVAPLAAPQAALQVAELLS